MLKPGQAFKAKPQGVLAGIQDARQTVKPYYIDVLSNKLPRHAMMRTSRAILVILVVRFLHLHPLAAHSRANAGSLAAGKLSVSGALKFCKWNCTAVRP